MPEVTSRDVQTLFDKIGATASPNLPDGLAITAPATGDEIARIARDDTRSVDLAIARARQAQSTWQAVRREAREAFLNLLAQTVAESQEALARLVTLEGGKPAKDALGEVGRAAGVLTQTVKDAAFADINNASYREIASPVGVVGLITSYNFPIAVANWTIGPGLLAGNAVVWKPSEKTPLTAIGYKALFDRAVAQFNASRDAQIVPTDLVQVVIGEREVGQTLVAHAGIDMISATGSVGMGKAVRAAVANSQTSKAPPILELGGNNAVVVSGTCSAADLQYAVGALMQSTVFGGGQLCTCTRRVIVHESVYDGFAREYVAALTAFVDGGGIRNPLTADPADDTFCFAPLIDRTAYDRVESALAQAKADGGQVLFGGERAMVERYPGAYYVVPALVEMPRQTQAMHEETFGPLIYLVGYHGALDSAMELVNAPPNAGLVNGIYTASMSEAEIFAERNQAGHGVVNSAVGTRAPMMWARGFGGNKDSGSGQILDRNDPLAAFTRRETVSRVAVHAAGITMT
jgi:aldehyde dehydrogenase (NAD+)